MSARNELTGPQFRPLSEALRQSFRLSQFDTLLKVSLDLNREDIALGEDYQDIVFRVIDSANRSGWVYRLVSAARMARPNNVTFFEYEQILGFGISGVPTKEHLESIIRPVNAFHNVAEFLSRLGQIAFQVCRVDIDGDGMGTGFFVNPRTVLTNYHVVEGLFNGSLTQEQITCRFDYKKHATSGAVSPGTVFRTEGVISLSPYDPAEWMSSLAEPAPDKLDYALLLLVEEAGNQQVGKLQGGDEHKRGWVRISAPTADAFSPNSPLFIVQHPATQPMKLALETQGIIGLNGNGTRVRHRVNTEPGSSGSPCFNQNWELIALHNGGDKDPTPTWNRGIPIDRIVEHIRNSGHGSAVDLSAYGSPQ